MNSTIFSHQMDDIDMVKSEVRQQTSIVMVTRHYSSVSHVSSNTVQIDGQELK